MISPLQVVHQLQEGQAPANWCVLRPARLFGPIRSLILGVCGGMLIMLYGTLFVTGAVQPALLHQSRAGPFGQPSIAIPMVLFSLTMSIVIAIWLNRYSKSKSDAALILMPEGVVSCEHLIDEAKRSCYVIEYAHITRITMKIEAMQYAGRVSLTLLYNNGTLETWRISNIYRSHAWIAQHIIAAHGRFIASSPKDSMAGT